MLLMLFKQIKRIIFTLSSSSISEILRSIARFSRFSNSDNVFFVV